MANGARNIPRLTNPTAYMLSQISERVDRYTKTRWQRMMGEKLATAMQSFYEGDDRALQDVMEIASETGQTAQIVPVVRDKMKEIASVRQMDQLRDLRRGVGPDLLKFLNVPQGLPQEAEDAFLRMYEIDPTGAVDLIQEAARRQRDLAYDLKQDPTYDLFTKGRMKPDPMMEWMEGLPRDAAGRVTGPSTYEPTEEDIYPVYPGMYQVPTSRLKNLQDYLDAQRRGEPVTREMLAVTPEYPVDEKWIAENVGREEGMRYLDPESSDYMNPMVLVEGFVGDKTGTSLRNLRGRAIIDFGTVWDTRKASLVTTVMSTLGPGTAGGDQLERLTKELGLKTPSLWNFIFNPGDIVQWVDAPRILLDTLKERPDKAELERQFEFAISQMRMLQTWEPNRGAYIRTRLEEFDVELGRKGFEGATTSGGEDLGGEATTSQARSSSETPPVTETELPTFWAINEKPEDYVPFLKRFEATGGDAEEYLGKEVFEKMDPPLDPELALRHIDFILSLVRK